MLKMSHPFTASSLLLFLTIKTITTSTLTTTAFVPSFTSYSVSFKKNIQNYKWLPTIHPSRLYNLNLSANPDDEADKITSSTTATKDDQDEVQQKQLKEINVLTKQMEQKETAINRLKFQLNELKTAADESEVKRFEAEKEVEKLNKEKKESFFNFDSLKAQFSQEKEQVKQQLRVATNALSKLQSESRQELEIAQKRAENEKIQMMTEIVNLKEDIDKMNQLIVRAKDDMNDISNDSDLLVEQKMKEIGVLDEKIKELVNVKNQYESRINKLEVELEKLKVALDESQKLKAQLQQKLDELKRQSELAKLADEATIAKVKNDLDQERTKFSNQLGAIKDQLDQVKKESRREIETLRTETKEEKGKLEEQISDLQVELANATDRIERARKAVFEVRQAADAKLARIEKESKRYKTKMRNLSSQEKANLEQRVWDLEFKVNKAKYDVIVAEKESRKLKEAAASHADEIKALEEAHQKELYDLEQTLMAKEVSFEKSEKESREKAQRLVIKFRNKIKRKEKKSIASIESLRQQILQAFDLENMEEVKNDFAGQAMGLSVAIATAAAKMKASNEEFKAKVAALEKSLQDLKESSKRNLEQKEAEYETNLGIEREKAASERDQLVAEKKREISKVEEEGRRNISTVRMEYTQKLNKSNNELEILKSRLEEKEKLIQTYEAEQRSYRKLAKFAWKATREKLSFKGRRKSNKDTGRKDKK